MYSVRPYTGLGSVIVGGPLTQCDIPVAAWFNGECWARAWDGLFAPAPVQAVAPPRAPSGAVLTVPPVSGADAQATVDALLDQQLIDQQALNASHLESSWIDRAASAAVGAGDAVSDAFEGPLGMSWLLWGALGLAVFGVVVAGAGSPRRYGR